VRRAERSSFSNTHGQGFENRIATLMAADLHEPLVYKWQRLDRGAIRESLNKSVCDVLMALPAHSSQVLTTSAYYRSSYVFVYRRDAVSKPSLLEDASLRHMKIGIQAVGEEYTPPGDALARRGLQSSIVPFHTNGGDEDEILAAVAKRKVDTAILWGPEAGYFTRLHHRPLELVPVNPQIDGGIPLTFAISMAVRKDNTVLLNRLNAVIARRSEEIHRILLYYGVPEVDATRASGAQP
jgi:mxaJ protein